MTRRGVHPLVRDTRGSRASHRGARRAAETTVPVGGQRDVGDGGAGAGAPSDAAGHQRVDVDVLAEGVAGAG